MQYISTRGLESSFSFSDILFEGYAEDGGLYVPAVFPKVDAHTLMTWRGLSYASLAFEVIRLFAEELVVVRRDPSKVQFVAQLNDFYFQFQKLANNYNQIVKVINAHFSNVAIPHQIAMLEQRTRELKTLSIEILHLAKQAKEWLRI